MRLWPFGKKTEALAKQAPPTDEAPLIATDFAMWRSYPADTISPQRLRQILKDADIGETSELMELLDDIANDPHVGSVLRTRKLAVAGAPWCIEPADKSDAARKIADEAKLFVEAIPHFRQMCTDILDAVYRGFSYVRPRWAGVDGKWRVVGHDAIEARFFRFENGVEPRLKVDSGSDGVPLADLPGGIWHAWRDKAGPVVRGGIGRQVAKFWYYKVQFLVDAASFLEKFGHPHIQVTTNLRKGTPEMEDLKRAARAFIVDQIGIVPTGSTIQVLDSQINKTATVNDIYLVFFEWCDAAISKAVLGQTLTTQVGKTGGAYAAAKVQDGVRQDLMELDAAQLADTLTSQLLKPWARYHFGENALAPRIVFDVEPPENAKESADAGKARAETIEILSRMGLEVSRAQLRDEYELREPENDEDTLEPPAPPPAAPIPGSPTGPALEPAPSTDGAQDDKPAMRALAATRARTPAEEGQAYADEVRRIAARMGADALSVDLADVLLEVRASTSFDDLRQRLAARFDGMDPSAFADVVRRARIMAELAGRLSVLTDA